MRANFLIPEVLDAEASYRILLEAAIDELQQDAKSMLLNGENSTIMTFLPDNFKTLRDILTLSADDLWEIAWPNAALSDRRYEDGVLYRVVPLRTYLTYNPKYETLNSVYQVSAYSFEHLDEEIGNKDYNKIWELFTKYPDGFIQWF